MKIYTKTGDKGETALYGGRKISKSDVKIEAYGTTDELNACIGCILSENNSKEIKIQLIRIQHDLFSLGAELATPVERILKEDGSSRIGKRIDENDILQLEKWMDKWDENLPKMTHFILPGGGKAATMAHLARTVCRRAERRVVRLAQEEKQNPDLQKYLNRLSDYLFVIARVLSGLDGEEEVKWIPEKQ